MKKMTKKEIKLIMDSLASMYPEAECELNFGTLYQLLVSVVLSAQTTDKSVNKVTVRLFEEYPDAFAMAKADEDDIQDIIKTIGMYKTKSKNVIALSKALVEKYSGQVPRDYDALIALPGVGRKTANVVLAVGFGEQRIAVDTHVFRVSNRIGIVSEKDVLKTELSLMEVLPKDTLSATHHSLIFHGRYCCHARKPACADCAINEWCKWEHKTV